MIVWLRELGTERRTFVLHAPLPITLEQHEEGTWSVEYLPWHDAPYTNPLSGFGATAEDALAMLREGFAVLWAAYVEADPTTLTSGAQLLARDMRGLVVPP